MDVESLAKQLILQNMTPEQQTAVLDSIRSSVLQAKEVQKQRVGENVQVVVQALKKLEADIRSRYDATGKAIEKRVASIKDGKDGRNGVNGKDGKDGRAGQDGATGPRGADGLNGRDGRDGDNGVSVTDANIDFDGSLIITLSSGRTINVGEVVAPDLAEQIKVITNGGGTSQTVIDALASLQTQIDNLIPSQTGNAGKYLTTDGTDLSWEAIAAGGLSYQGTWNASTNTPTLTSGSGGSGYYYIVATAGSTNLDGITDWEIGDWLLYNGTVWQKIDQSNLVTSVNGQTGAVSLTSTNISEGTNLYYTDARARAAVSAGTGISYDNSTGVITNAAPDQTVALTGAGTTTVTGTYPNFTISSADSTVGTVTSVSGTGTVNGISLSGTVTSSGNLTLGGTLDLSSPPAIGGATPAAGAFTSLTATSETISANTTSDALRITQLGTGNALLVEDSANPDATPVVIDNSGKLISGYTAVITYADSFVPILQGNYTVGAAWGISRWSNNTSSPRLSLAKSRGAAVATRAIVLSGDELGNLVFEGDDGSDFIRGAQISAFVDGTPGTNDMPGRLVFSTTADGASTPTERMRITSAGKTGFATSAPAATIHVAGTTIISNVDVLNATYDSVSFSVAAQETVPQALFFSADGSKMFVMGSNGDDVNEYVLSTPWVVSSATYSTVFSVSGQDTVPTGLFFRADGLKMYVVGQTNDTVFQYALTSPWSVATASYESISFSVATQEIAPTGIFFKPDGLSMYITGSTSDGIYQYTLSTAWNVSTATFLQTFSVSGQEATPQDLSFTGDGTRMFLLGSTGDDVNVYNLTTPWDISTATSVGAFSVAAQDIVPAGLYIKPDGTKMYIAGQTNDTVFQYSVPSVEIELTGTTAINGSATVAQDLTVYGNTQVYKISASSVATFSAGTAALPSITTTGDTNTGIFFPAADTIAFAEGGAEAMRIDSSGNLLFNSGYGSVATAYGCRAWVNFNGTGTVAIRASGNVSSITDNGVGYYRVNFTTAMPDVNYAIVNNASDDATAATITCTSGTWGGTNQTTTSALIFVGIAGAGNDRTYVGVSIFR